jgi:molybdopterin synthase catalytic subunit
MAEAEKAMSLEDGCIHVELTEKHLDVISVMNHVRSPKAGAIVIFAGVSSFGFRIRDQVHFAANTVA